jgi:hypothetical protein
MKRTAVLVLGVVVALAGCGDDDDVADTPQTELADKVLEGYDAVDGLDVDEQCVRDLTDALSDADAQLGIDTFDDTEPANEALAAWVDGLSDCLSS